MSPMFVVGLVFGLVLFIFLIYQCESKQEEQIHQQGAKQATAEGEGKKKKPKNKKKKEAKVEVEAKRESVASESSEEEVKPKPVVQTKAAKNKGK